MPIKAIVTDLNTVDENLRSLYVEKDGKFFADVEPVDGYELDNVKGLKSALGAERNLKATLEQTVKAFEGLDATSARQALEQLSAFGDLTPAQAKKFKEDYEKLAALDPTKEADKIAQELVKQRETALQGEFTKREKELADKADAAVTVAEALKGQLKKLMVDNAIAASLATLDPLDDARDALAVLAQQAIRTKEVNGQFVVEVIDEQGNPRIKDHHGTPVTVADYLAEIKKTRPGLFKADNIQGTGIDPKASAPKSTSNVVNPWKAETRNLTEQMRITRTDPALAQRLKAEAGIKK